MICTFQAEAMSSSKNQACLGLTNAAPLLSRRTGTGDWNILYQEFTTYIVNSYIHVNKTAKHLSTKILKVFIFLQCIYIVNL